MNKLNEIWTSKVLLAIVAVIVLAVIFVFNRLFPLFADDWVYSFIFENSFFDHSLKPIESVSDIFVSQYNHYFLWGGRNVVHLIDQFLLSINPFVCDLLNSLAYIALIYLIYAIANYGRKVNVGVFIFVVCFSWVFIPQLTSNVFWITGSANYLWGTLILLLFIYPFYTYFLKGEKPDDGIVRIVLMLLFGIVAGWTNENTVPPILLMIFILGIYLYRKKILPKWMLAGFIGLCIGYAVMVLAPGNYVRMEFELVHAEKMSDASMLSIFTGRLGRMMSKNYLLYMLPVIAVYIIMFFIYRKYRDTDNSLTKKKLYVSVAFFFAGHISFFIMLASTTFPLRAMFGMILYLSIAIGLLYSEIKIDTPRKAIVNSIFVILLLCLYSFDVWRKYPSIYLISETFKDRELLLEQQKSEGIQDIVFEARIGFHEKYGFQDLEPDSTAWMNKEYAKFHGIRSVKALNKE